MHKGRIMKTQPKSFMDMTSSLSLSRRSGGKHSLQCYVITAFKLWRAFQWANTLLPFQRNLEYIQNGFNDTDACDKTRQNSMKQDNPYNLF